MCNESDSAIACIFLNPSDTSVSERTCCITYGLCDQNEPKNPQDCNKDSLYRIELNITGHSLTGQKYCYTVMASNGTYKVKVEGKFTIGTTELYLYMHAAIHIGI